MLRHRINLEQKQYAPTTITLRLAAVRRIAYEVADSRLLSLELAAGIRRVKGVRRLGVPVGNWLTAEQGKRLLTGTNQDSLPGKRNYEMLAMLIGCGFRRGELLGLHNDAIRLREERWVIADLVRKAGHIRTVPIPDWVKAAIDGWKEASGITEGVVFRSINRAGRVWGNGMTPKVFGRLPQVQVLRSSLHMILVGPAPVCAAWPEANWTSSNSCSGMSRSRRQNDISDVSRSFGMLWMTVWASSQTTCPELEDRRATDNPLATYEDLWWGAELAGGLNESSAGFSTS